MRKFTGVLCSILLVSACSTHKPGSPKPEPTAPSKPIIAPDYRPVGTVAKVDATGRFIVISFPVGAMPKQDEPLNIYRNGLKVAEVKVDSKFQSDSNVVADIVAGEVQVGDEARQN